MKVFFRPVTWVKAIKLRAPLVASLTYRGSQSISGLFLLFIISKYFSPIEQGYYYLFSSIIALQLFIDLGLNVVVVNMASHEWAIVMNEPNEVRNLKSKTAQSRLASLVIFVAKWYSIGAVVLIIFCYIVGTLFFIDKELPTDQWYKQWIAHMFCASALFFLSPLLSVLEGCDRVTSVNFFRAIQNIFAAVLFLLAASQGLGLASVAIFSASMLISAIFYIGVINYKFFKNCLSQIGSHKISWKIEIWNLQKKISLQAIFSYLGYYALVPIVSQSHGAEAAGQLGLSLQIGITILQISFAIVSANIPSYGILHATGKVKSALQKWKRDVFKAVSFAIFMVAIIFVIQHFNSPSLFATVLNRGIPGISSILMYIGACSLVFLQSIAAITRSNKSEILTLVGVTSPILIAALSYLSTFFFDVRGVAIIYFAVNSLFALPFAIISFKGYLIQLPGVRRIQARSATKTNPVRGG